MRQVVISFLLLLMAGGVFFGLAHFGGTYLREHPNTLPPALAFLQPGNPWSENILKLLGTLLLAPTLPYFLVSVARLGGDEGRHDPFEGVTTLRLKSGFLFLFVPASGALSALFIFVALEGDQLGLSLFMAAFGLFFGLMCLWMIVAFVSYDREGLINTHWSFRRKRYAWNDLVDVGYNREAMQYELHFGEAGKAKISSFYTGMEALIERANEELSENWNAYE
ncbi:hypothetical protein [Aliiroseovarius crassostreae]|uniref:hypothetical protein n=1 Tax=Aliiroseovarius crassostreae TaxID=154981 RepID=UPI002201074B|nr:hypothetical protein [Aliiroseovarius crassostreae]UWP89141.1 hypothetical protein K3J57_15055 [Aliiroseovarius crassostreae]UWP98597.1 hypothetical protein K3X53_14965 [Aliiroseovarius crassostreae]UWQ01783.1 hypothetical protein K3X44_15275 [Aliiroseovarius crassostreae]